MGTSSGVPFADGMREEPSEHARTPFQATKERPGVPGRVLPRPEQRLNSWGAAESSSVLIFHADILPRVWVG